MFLSLPFIILFTCCLILYYTVKGNYQKPVLLLTSCIFVGYFNIAYLLIAALIAAITFYWGRWCWSFSGISAAWSKVGGQAS